MKKRSAFVRFLAFRKQRRTFLRMLLDGLSVSKSNAWSSILDASKRGAKTIRKHANTAVNPLREIMESRKVRQAPIPAYQLCVESLEDRRVMAASVWESAVGAFGGSDGIGKDGPMADVGLQLTQLYYAQQQGQLNNLEGLGLGMLESVIANDRVLVDLSTDQNIVDFQTSLTNIGMQVTGTYKNLVSGWLPISSLDELAATPGLGAVTPAVSSRAVGATTSQGDESMTTDGVKQFLGFNGAGQKVGILSDSYNDLGGANSDVAGGDLPGVGNPNGLVTPVQVLDDTAAGGNSDEGRAMLQIVHDVAPGAALAFHTAFTGQAAFAQGILDLQAAGSTVIADDVFYFAEPFFSDGVIAQAADTVASTGTPYFALANNHGRNSYESAYRPSTAYLPNTFASVPGAPAFDGGVAQDFDPGAGVDDFQSFTLNNNQRILLSFQWDNPFLSHTGGAAGATTDMDIYVLNSANQIVAGSASINGGGDPLELFSFTNTTGSTQTYNLMMVRFGGTVPSFVKYINITNGSAGMGALQFATNSGTAYGHANADLGMSIGAAFYGNTPEFGLNPAQAEPFSSAGGIPIRFDDVGNPIVPVIRENPDVVGPDGANTTFFGGDIAADADSFPNFFGTSAATPHVAALAALIRQANPGISVSALNNTLRSTAQDMDDASTGGFDVGYDAGTGFGFVNGPAALAAGPAGPFPVTFAGTSGNDILRVVRNGANTEFYRGGVLQFSFPASEIANITINGGNGSDTLTLDYTFGNPSPAGAINFAGGESAGDDDRLVVTGYNVPNLTVNHTGPEAGNINSGSFTINFSEIEPLALSGTAADLIVNFPAGPNNAVLGDDTNANFPALGLGLANTSAIDAPTFEYTSFTNPTNSLTVNFGVNGDTLTMRAMDATFAPAGASPVTINGEAGIDTVNVVATNAGVTTTINGGGSLDVINIGNAGAVGTPGLLTPIAGPVFVNGQAGGADLTVDGSGAGVNADYNVTFNTVTRSVPAGFGGVTYTGLTSLLVTVGNGINNVTVPSTSVPTTINTNGSADIVTIGNGSLDAVVAAVTVIGGAGAPDSLIVNDSTDASINNYAITSTSITRAGAGLITYDGTTEDVTLNTGTNIDFVSVLSTAVNTVYNINTGNGDDLVEIGALFNSVNNIDGQINLTTGIGTDTLIVNDDADAVGDNYTLTQVGTVSELSFGDGAAAVDIRFDATGAAGQVEFFELRTGTGLDVININNTTATNTSTVTSNAGDDTWNIDGDGLQGNNNFDSASGVDTFNLNVNVAITATSLSIDGQGANGDSAQRDQLTINDGNFGSNIGFNYLAGGTAGLNVTGMGTTVNTNNLENVVYGGNSAAVSVTGTTGTDDITVAPRNGVAQIFLGGNPWDGPSDGLFANALPGVAGPGANKGPDIFVTGLPLFSNINVSGGGGVDDQLYLYGESENAIVDPASAGQPVFRGLGLANGVIVPGQGAGNASDDINVSDGITTFNFNNSVRILTPTDFSQTNSNIPGLIVNSGDEAGPAGDFISATPSANFKIQINGGEPPIANAPIGDTLRVTTPGTAQVFSDKVGNVSVNAAGLLGVSFTSIERTEVVPGNGRVQLIGDNNDPAVDQTDHFVVVGQDIGGDGGDADGANEFTLRINADTTAPAAPALYFNNVTNLDVFGADLTGVDGGQVDTLEITPWADNTPRGWGIATFFDEDAPAGADGAAVDLLIVHTSAFGGSVSENIVVQPSGLDNGEVNITNAAFGTPIANISYINNTDIIVLDDDGFLSDTDTLTLNGTNPGTPQASGNDTFNIDLTAAGNAANPLVDVRSTNPGGSLYRIQNFTGFNTLNIAMLGGRDTANVIGRNNGSLALEIDGGSDSLIDIVNFTGTVNANDSFQLGVGPTNDSAVTFTQKSGSTSFTRSNLSRVDNVGFQGGGGTGIDTFTIFGSDAANHVSVQATSALSGSVSIDSFPVLDYSGLGSGTGGTFSRIDLRSDNFSNGNPDSLKVTGTIGTDTYTYTPTSATSGNLLLATGGNSVNFITANFGSVALDAANSTDALNVAVTNAIITPGATSDSGTVTATSTGGQGLLPLNYSNVESAVVTGGTVVVTGTEGNDIITVDAAGLVTVANSGGIVQQQYNLAGVNSLVINSNGGDDSITIAPSALFPRGITVIGGVNGNGSDTLSVSGADVVVDLETSTVNGVIGGPISFTGIEHLNATATATITVNGNSGADLLTVTPTGANTATIVPSVGGLLSINTDNPDALTINTAGGSDTVSVIGTSSNDTIGVARTATAQVTVGALKAIQISNSESLRIAGGDGNDTINVTGTGSTAFLVVDGGLNTTNDTLTVTNATAGATTYTPGSSSDSGTITTPDGGIEVLGTELITLAGATAGDTLTANGTHGNDTIALQFLGGANRIWLNGQSVISLSSFGTVNLNGRFGDDKINVLPVGLVGVTTVNVNGGDPTASDTLVVTGTAAQDNVVITPTGIASATVTGLGPIINAATVEHLTYSGLGGNDVITFTGTAGNDTITHTPGTTDDAGNLRNNSLLALDYQNLGATGAVNVDGLGSDDNLVAAGTINSDAIRVAGVGAVNVNTRLSLNPIAIENLRLDGLEGDDAFNIDTTFAGPIGVVGSTGTNTLTVNGVVAVPELFFVVPDITPGSGQVNANTALNYTGISAVSLNGNLDDSLVIIDTAENSTWKVGSAPFIGDRTQLDNRETVDYFGFNDVQLIATNGADTFVISPTGLSGSATPLVVFGGPVGSTNDRMIIQGTTGNDAFVLNANNGGIGGAQGTVTLNGSSVVFGDITAVELNGQAGNDNFDVTALTTASLFVDGSDPIGPVGDTLALTVPAGAGTTTYAPGPENDEGGFTFSAGGVRPVSFYNIEALGPVNVAAAGGALIVCGTDANDVINVTGVTPDSVTVSVNAGPAITYTGVTTLTIQAKAGDDSINLAPGPFAGTINVEGGDPTASDTLTIAGTAGVDNVTFTGTSQSSGSLTGLGAPVNFTTIEHVVYDGNDLAALDQVTINGTLTNDTFSYDANSLKGSFRSFASPDFDTIRSARIVVNGGGSSGADAVNILGSSGADTVTSAANAITINTTGTAAIITLGAGIDAVTVSTLDSNDNVNLSGITVAATVFGGDGNDTIVGSPQVDSLYGGAGNDILVGGAGNDFEYGEEGNDTFGNLTLTADGVADDAGADQAFGGEGFDNFVWEPGDGADVNNGGGDAADIFRFFGNAAANVFTLRQGGTPTHFNALIGALVIDNHGIEDVIVDGQGGADTFVVDDLYATEVVSVSLNLGAADAAAIDPVTISGRNVADNLSVTSSGPGSLSVQGLRYNVNLTNAEATDTLAINGNDGDDQITDALGASSVLTTTLNGNNGDDRLTGNVTFMNGNDGNDTLIGGADNQTMDGGAGDDTFVGNGGTDNIGGGLGSSVGDTILVAGTTGNDTIALSLNAAGQLVVTVNGLTTTYGNFVGGPIASSGIEQLLVQGSAGNDTLSVDSTNGAIPILINFDGGNNADTLTLTGGVATSDTYEVGPNTDQGTSTIVIGGVTQVVRFNALEPVFDLVAGPLTVVATDADNAINYTQGGVAANGLVSIDGFETIEFSNKTTLTIDALAGSDTINLNNPNTPTGLTAINVNGDDPTGSDKLVVNGTAGNDAINYTPSNTVGSGSVAITGAPVVNFTTTESLAIDGQGGTDALTVTSPSGHRVTITPGSAADSGTIGSQGFGAGTASVPLSYAHIGALGTVTIAGSGDIVEFNGTANSDRFSVTGTTAQIFNATSGFVTNLFTLSNVFQLELRGLDGDDTFNVTGTLAPITGGIVVDGGNPSASDVLNLSGATGAVSVSLADASLPSLTSITGYGTTVQLTGIETANLNASGNAVTVTGTSQPEAFSYTPTGATAGTITSAGLNTVFNASNVAGALTLNGSGGVDSVTVNGTSGADTIAVVKGATTTVGVNGLQVLSITSASTENVTVNAGDGNDTINLSGTTASNQVVNILGGAPTSNALGASDILNIAMSTAGTTAVAPGATPDAGLITSPDGTTAYSGIESFNLTGLAAGANTINVQGTHDNDTIALQFIAGNRVWINDRAVYTFSNYPTVNINGLFGDDKINVLPIGLVGVTTINVAGGDPTASDELVVSGSAGNDAINYTTSNTVGSGSVAITGAPVVNFTTTESLAIDGQGGTDALTVISPSGHRTTITPGLAADSGTIGSQGFGAGTASVPLSYAHIGATGTVTIAGSGDIVEFNGTANSDRFSVTGTTAQIFNATSGFVTNLFTLSNVFQLELRGLDGDDTFNVTGTLAPIAGGVVVDGGNPSASDVLNLNAPTGAVVVNLASNTVTGYGALVEMIGIETLNANVNNNNFTLNGSAGNDSLEVTPTSANSATFRLTKTSPASGSTPVVNASQIETLSVDLLSGDDVLSVNGTTAGEAIAVTGALVTVGALETVNFAGVEALSVFAQQGADTITVTPGAAPVFIDGGDPIGIIQGDKLIVNNAVAFFAGPENDEGGVKTNGGDVSFDHIESLTVAAIVGCPLLILGTNGDDDITVIARDASTTVGADGVQDFTFSVNSGMDVVVLNQADLYIDAMAGDDDIVIRTAAPNEAAWDVSVFVAGGSPSIGAPAEADRLVLETPNNAGGSDTVVFNPTGADTGSLVVDKNANGTYEAAGTDSLITFGSFVFNCPPAGVIYNSTAGGVELIQYNGEGAPAIDDNLVINGTAFDDTTVVNQGGVGSGTFSAPGDSPLFQFQSFNRLTVNPGTGGFDLVEINGTVGPDTVTSNANTVTLTSPVTLGQGIDQLNINTFDGNDNVDLDLALTGLKKVINLGAGNDIANLQGVLVDPADPVIYGGDGDDSIIGSPNADFVYGGSGNDVLIGAGGDDQLYGEAGNDIFGNPSAAPNAIAEDAGNDLFNGGEGSDTFVWEPGDGSDTIEGGAGEADVLSFFGGAGAETFNVFAKLSDPTRAILFRNIGSITIDLAGVDQINVTGNAGADSYVVGRANNGDSGSVAPIGNAYTNPTASLSDLSTTEVKVVNITHAADEADFIFVDGRTVDDNITVSVESMLTNTLRVAGLPYDVRINGATTADRLTVRGNEGNDNIRIVNSNNATVAGLVGVNFAGGAGNDTLIAASVLIGGLGDDLLQGGGGADQLFGNEGEDTMIGGAGSDTLDGGPGVDTILVRGTSGNDSIGINQPTDVTLIATVNLVADSDTLVLNAGAKTVERVSVEAGLGNDIISVQWVDALGVDANANALRVDVDGGDGSTGDRLGVVDLSAGDLILDERGTTTDSGAMTVGPGNAEPLIVTYKNVEYAQPIAAADGDVVVFKNDPYEFNNVRTSATYLGANASINVDPNINPGVDPVFGFPADQDWFRVVAEKTGILDFQVYFRQVATVGSGRPGLPNAGNLDIAVTDAAGNVINGFGNNDNSNDERVRIPAVAGQTYYLRVFANGNAINTYNITVANYVPPTPRDLELLDTPVGDLANSDTGRSQFDNITRDNTPTLVFRLDDGIFLNDLPGNSGAGAPPDEVIPIGFQAIAGTAGYRIAIFDEGASPGPGNQTGTAPQVPIGFATFVSPGVYQFTTPVLSEGSHFLTARVQMVDPASPLQTGFGERSVALEVIIDTVVPPAFFGNSTSPTDGLKADSDSGIASVIATFADRITNDVTPSMYGSAEANSIIRLFVDRTNNGFTADDILLGQTVTRPLSGTDQSLGEWDITSTTSLNSPDLVASIGKDGVRRLFITAEDVAGNVSAPADLDLMLDTTPAIVSAVTLPNGESIFGLKPTPKPTPAVNFMTVTFTGGPVSTGGFNLLATDPGLATNPRNYQLVGDHNGNILIASATVVSQSDTSVVVRLNFSKPLPDDRFTLTLDDAIADAANNALDGESQAQSPGLAGSVLPSGNGISGGDFKARFTVDSRPEVGVVSEGIVYVDINGNNLWDPQGIDGDSTNRDLVFQFGQLVDAHFAGNFAPVGAAVASGYDKLGAYGKFAGNYSFVLDTNDDGVADFSSLMPGAYQVNGLPVAGNFNAAHPGDEIGLFDGSFWYLDTNGNNQIDLGERFASNFNGLPIVGDFDGNGTDDLAAFNNSTNTFTFDTNRDGNADFTWRVADDVQRFVGLSGFTDRPVAGDLNLDGIDDIGLWVKDRQGTLPRNSGEYFFWVSDRANPNPALVYDSYSPDPLGNDLFAEFGDELGLPIFGNFDPPVVSGDSGNPLHNTPAPLDVDGDGFISPLDVLIVVNVLNEYPAFPSSDPVRTYYTIGQKMADPNNDRSINPLDALTIINYLNSKSGSGSGEGEGEESAKMVVAKDTSSVDAVFSQLGLDVEGEVVGKKRRK